MEWRVEMVHFTIADAGGLRSQKVNGAAVVDLLIMDLERLNRFNSRGCPACGRKFSLADPVVVCGAWEGGAKVVHENEAVLDHRTGQYVER